MEKIDFVVTWVNGNDKKWLEKRNKYSQEKASNNPKYYRDWGMFKFWFRGVEKYAPWVNKVYLVVDDQLPSWLDVENSKLKIINHTDYIPNDVLPVFNSNAIECCLNRIDGLAEHFVYFNDDMFITNKTKPTDFFVNGLPSDIGALSPIIPWMNGTANYQVNNVEIINKYFSKDEVLRNSHVLSLKYGIDNIRTLQQLPGKLLCGFYEPHMPESFLRDTFEELWTKEPNILTATMKSRFRSKYNTNIWLFRDWQLASGKFVPKSMRKFGHFYSLAKDREIWNDLTTQKYKIMCINDDFGIDDVQKLRSKLFDHFIRIFPERSSFEK